MLQNKIKEIIEQKGININQLSEELGYTYVNTYNLINKKPDLTNVRFETMVNLSKILGVEIKDLYKEVDCIEWFAEDFVIEDNTITGLTLDGQLKLESNNFELVFPKLDNIEEVLNLSGLGIKKVDFNNLKNLKKINGFGDNKIYVIKLDACINLEQLIGFGNNKIKKLDLGNCKKLEILNGFEDNGITKLNADLPNLTTLSGFDNNPVKTLEFSKKIKVLNGFENSKLDTLDLTDCTELVDLCGFGNTGITELNLSNCCNLGFICGFRDCNIKEIDLDNTKVTDVGLDCIGLEKVKISNKNYIYFFNINIEVNTPEIIAKNSARPIAMDKKTGELWDKCAK